MANLFRFTEMTSKLKNKGGFPVIAENIRSHVFSTEICRVILADMVLTPDFSWLKWLRVVLAMTGNPLLEGAICLADSFEFTLYHCMRLKSFRHEWASLNRIAADKSHSVIVALRRIKAEITRSHVFFHWNRSSDTRCHGFGARFLLIKMAACSSCYDRKSALRWLTT